MNINLTFVIGNESFFGTVENESLTLGTFAHLGNVIEAKHHILCRHRDGCAVGRIEDVVALEHQQLRLKDSLVGEREVNSHLVTVEVSIECRTSQWMKLNGLAFNELGLESLDAKTVKRRSTVEEHWMALHNKFKNVPNDGIFSVDNLLCRLNSLDDATLNEFADDKRLVELRSHQLRQTAFAHLQLRTDDDNRTGRIVNTLTEQVLTEAALLTLQ